jgi:predicted MPP superfamily phosphohydrolase
VEAPKSTKTKRWSRRKFLAGMFGAGVGGYAYMRYLEPRWLSVGRHEVSLGRPGSLAGGGVPGSTPIRLLQLSDFHASEDVSLDFIHAAIRKGVGLKPDLICLTGDFITWRYDAFKRYAEILKPLADTAPTYATLGNHDGGRWVGTAGYSDTNRVRQLVSDAGIQLLHNRSVDVEIRSRPLRLAGVGDLWAGEIDATTAFATPAQPPPPGDTKALLSSSDPTAGRPATILLSHNPDSKELLQPFPWELMLCGHTHGGQCDLVFFGTPFAPVQDKRFVRGLHKWSGRWIHITRGVGNLHGMRFNCRPEISLLTLV